MQYKTAFLDGLPVNPWMTASVCIHGKHSCLIEENSIVGCKATKGLAGIFSRHSQPQMNLLDINLNGFSME